MRTAAAVAVVAVSLGLPAAAAGSGSSAIRHVNLAKFPRVSVTAVAPAGERPTLLEDGRRADYAKAHELAAAESLMLAIDNSQSMRGRPLTEAKRAAAGFLAQQRTGRLTGLVVFGHEALAVTRPGEATQDVGHAIASLAPDTEPGTSLYDAIGISIARLQRMSSGTRILVLLTDGRDKGSHSTLQEAVEAAQRANVIVYAIAAGQRVDSAPLATLAKGTGGALFNAGSVTELSRTYDAVRRDLDRTWQISYLSRARPGDRVQLTLRSGSAQSTAMVRIPSHGGGGGLIPASIARTGVAAAVVVLLAALLLTGAAAVGMRSRAPANIRRLLEPHVGSGTESEGEERAPTKRVQALVEWAERSLEDLPGAERLEIAVERSGLNLRVGHVPFLAAIGAFFLGAAGTIVGAGPKIAVLLMLIGLAAPLIVLRVAARRRTKAFDRQLPDVLAGIASTLRAGHGLRTALRAIADDGSPPASVEFKRVLGEERLGRPLDEAIDAMCARVASPDLDYVAVAIKVHSQTGGSLAALFDTLSETVRERQRHARRVRALTSMGRMSATVLVCLPFGLATLMTLINPSYMAPLFQTAAGHILLGVCVGSMTVGGLFLKKIVNVRY
jgi:tight adherence protein B